LLAAQIGPIDVNAQQGSLLLVIPAQAGIQRLIESAEDTGFRLAPE